ncbi:Flagellar motor protein MotB [Saccharicrinis carchari]|uniref:Flagellar motor protein MotB n=1 Tax=Saccharicrinis carchari TaxID=1168039 RepID=A0A521CLJ6_SACCC|nr:OmpA family protein [Saccharicrinis carchari]SMO60294.1 Flagellar motor protein MotB [Saccharicrinis carchari]
MRISKSFVVIVWLLIWVTSSFAQFTTDKRLIEEHMRFSGEKKFNRWDIMLGYGPNIYFTDFTDYLIIPDGKWHFSPSVALSYQLVPALAIDFRYMQGDMQQNGIHHHYDGNFLEFTGAARFYINQMINTPGPVNDKWNFYVNVGFGLQALRNRVYKNTDNQVLHASDVEGKSADGGYFVFGYDKNDPYKKISRERELVLPVGVGVLYRINRSFDLGIESNIHYGLEDNLDGILSGATNDSYWHTTINISYKIGKKNKRHSKWTYRTYGFNIFGNKRKDPLEDEVNQFERMVQQQAGILRLQIDSVITEEKSTRIYRADNTFPIYFMPGGATFKDYENQVTMAQVAVLLRKHADWSLQIVGFADKAESNPDYISKKRADTVMQYLIDHYGVDKKRMQTSAMGAREQLTVEGSNKIQGRIHVDRRADIILIKPKVEAGQ